MGVKTFHSLKKVLKDKGLNTAVGDEGGFAPDLASNEEALKFIVEAIEKGRLCSGRGYLSCNGSGSTEFYVDGKYRLEGEGVEFDAAGMADYYAKLVEKYPIGFNRGME